jgi:hypothetical protein
MSRALLVLDTDHQRRKAQDWIWAAKPGSRVEFKGPQRSVDQNSLMWALLTDIAVHMRKVAGLEYSTEEWKHVFLHGWGREVRFLPALDGRGVVPVPQSSSDLSKEEMTDFIEYILKEGAERGIVFHDQSRSSSEPSPSDGGSSGKQEAAQAPAADLPADAADAVAGDIVEEREEPGSSPAPDQSDRAECVSKLLRIATDKDLTREQAAENLGDAAENWLGHLGDKEFVTAVFNTAKKVLKGELQEPAARKYLETLTRPAA